MQEDHIKLEQRLEYVATYYRWKEAVDNGEVLSFADQDRYLESVKNCTAKAIIPFWMTTSADTSDEKICVDWLNFAALHLEETCGTWSTKTSDQTRLLKMHTVRCFMLICTWRVRRLDEPKAMMFKTLKTELDKGTAVAGQLPESSSERRAFFVEVARFHDLQGDHDLAAAILQMEGIPVVVTKEKREVSTLDAKDFSLEKIENHVKFDTATVKHAVHPDDV